VFTDKKSWCTIGRSKELRVAASEQLSKLAARAKEAEDQAAAARAQATTELQQDVDANKGKISGWWHEVQNAWTAHVAKVREGIDTKKAEHDVGRAEKRADLAEHDATFAVPYVYAAIEEAQYAVLDAELARRQADELKAASGAGEGGLSGRPALTRGSLLSWARCDRAYFAVHAGREQRRC
jgi:hypothetical protein